MVREIPQALHVHFNDAFFFGLFSFSQINSSFRKMQKARPGQTGGDNLTRTDLPSASFPDSMWDWPEEMKLNIVFFPHQPFSGSPGKEHPDRMLTAFR